MMWRCRQCGSVFWAHRCGAPPDPVLIPCRCGHPFASHHRTATGRVTFCTVHSGIRGSRCPCEQAVAV